MALTRTPLTTTQLIGAAGTLHAGEVDLVLLASEPYHFREPDLAEAAAAVPSAQISLIDGELPSWYGSRATHGLRYLTAFAQRLQND